jgi:hypothetical protein
MLSPAPIQQHTTDENGKFPLVWIRWFTQLTDAVNRLSTISVPAIAGDITLTLENSTVLCDATSGAFTVTLPDVLEFTGVVFTIKKINTSANDVTVDGDGANVESLSTWVLTGADYPSITIQSDGTEWWIL